MDRWSLIAGGIAGLVATAPMSAVMLGLRRLLPRREQYALPPRQITVAATRKAGVDEHLDEPVRSLVTVVAHFGYGAAAGTMYAPLSRWVPLPPVAAGTAYGLVVWATSYLGLLPGLGLISPATDHPTRRNALMIVAHMVWGAALALLLERLDAQAWRR
jgi:putative membrane protein